MNSAVSPQQAWQQHVTGAVRKFLKTAVVIDNQPSIDAQLLANVAPAEATGMGDDAGILVTPAHAAPIESANDLNIRNVTDAFISKGIACALVLPDDRVDDDAAKIKRSLDAAKVSDLVVIDWYLKDKDSSLTLRILEKIASSDFEEKGRLRLVCIYTSEQLTTNIFEDVTRKFSDAGITFTSVCNESYCAIAKTTLVLLANKDQVPVRDLPHLLINQFTKLADGLIPSFALAAVGAIRKNTHHMLTRFHTSLDSAYVSNRLITNPPGDVTELMRELLVAECDNAIGLDRVADEFLENDTITKWLNYNNKLFNPVTYKTRKGEDIEVTFELLNAMLKNGVGDNEFKIKKGQSISFPEEGRNSVSITLAGSPDASRNSENEFSRLVAFRREANGTTTRLMNPKWRPSITTGTVLKYSINGETKYLMCFTPACDTLRIESKDRPFVFIEGSISEKPYNLVLSSSDNQNIGIYFDKKHPVVRTFCFAPDRKLKRVLATKVDQGDNLLFKFSSTDQNSVEFEWVGEIRYNRAVSEMATLANIWMRIGIVDSEYLRLSAKGNFSFS